ncbi:AAA family ATPase [Lewinella sp. W8]|uniref:AAA family ATPase n=1 Tax=Lewinella sp. W8 TaxID=2528208 RepID=UPI0010671FBF|nr:AAA family ATPase [Lewinella sp. W8]MTB50871.1 AAA family ATPase [Lewinella sp. W8]
MDFIFIFGPSAVGKMTVGKVLAERLDYKLFHNHVSRDFAEQYFELGTESFKALNRLIRFGMFEIAAKSDLKGFIFTFVWAVDMADDEAYVDKIVKYFTDAGARVHYVELFADQSVRLTRNRHPDRLAEKPSKRKLEASERVLRYDDENYRLNTLPGEFPERNILKIDNTHRSPEDVAEEIIRHFGLSVWEQQ